MTIPFRSDAGEIPPTPDEFSALVRKQKRARLTPGSFFATPSQQPYQSNLYTTSAATSRPTGLATQ